MKKWMLFLLLFGLLFATTMPVSAARNGPRSVFTLVGNITAIDDGAVTVQVLGGNKLAQPYIDQAWTVTVTSSTRYLLNDGTVVTPITFADLKVGDPVSVYGTLANDDWIASRITVGAKLIHHQ